MPSKAYTEDGDRGSPPKKPKFEWHNRRYHVPRNKRPATTSPSKIIFNGITEDLKGHIYNVGTGSQADQFTATTKALASYSGHKCTDHQDLKISIKRQKDVVIPIPSKRTDINEDIARLLLVK